MKTTKMILMILSISIIFAAFTIQTNKWEGTWDTSFGLLEIQKNNNFKGTFPKGSLTGKIIQGNLEGNYVRNVGTNDKHKLGQKGKFKFIMLEGDSKFEGYFMPEGHRTWLNEKWIGTKRLENLSIQIQPTQNINQISWTGTWKTDKLGNLKVKVTDKDNIKGKGFKKGSVDYILTSDLDGSNLNTISGNYSEKNFIGRFKNSEGKTGSFYFVLGWGTAKNLNEFTGYLEYDDQYHNGKLIKAKYKENISGTRISSNMPSMTNYN